MITEILANTNPMNLSGMSTASTGTVKSLGVALEAEYCCVDCEYSEYAFYDSGGERRKNDLTSFLVRRGALTETWAFVLFKDGVFKANLNSSALGTYYDFTSLEYDDLKGMIVDWALVAAAHGNGDYHVQIQKTFAGTTLTRDSHIFKVRPYSFDLAKGSVKIETYQDGTFVGTGFTYRNMNWYQSIRLQGCFWNKQPKLNSEEYLDSDRQRKPHWQIIVNTYDLELPAIPSSISNILLYDNILANRILISDYNTGFEVYDQLPVSIKEITEAEMNTRNNRGFFKLQFTDQSQGTIKSGR